MKSDQTTTPRAEIPAEELVKRLAQTVQKIRATGLFTYRDIASAFMSVGLEIARNDQGPVQAAEWLRGIADEIERPELQ